MYQWSLRVPEAYALTDRCLPVLRHGPSRLAQQLDDRLCSSPCTEHEIRFSDEPCFEQYDEPTHLEDGTLVIPKELSNVVVLLHDWPGGPEAAEFAPTLLTHSVSVAAYSKFVPTLWQLAEFIRSLGYYAIPCGNDVALTIPLAVDAGLGQVGRHSSLINPKYGLRCRITKIFTNMPLPHDGAKDFGITEFCDVCDKCGLKCGGKAIPTGPRSFDAVNECNVTGVNLWMVDAKKCFDYQNRVGSTCSICTRMCPWTKGHNWVHLTTRWFIQHCRWDWLHKFWVWLDDVMGYGTYKGTPALFWFGEEPTHRWLYRLLSKAPSRAWYRIGMRRRQLPVSTPHRSPAIGSRPWRARSFCPPPSSAATRSPTG